MVILPTWQPVSSDPIAQAFALSKHNFGKRYSVFRVARKMNVARRIRGAKLVAGKCVSVFQL
jgi:hypothetical protein